MLLGSKQSHHRGEYWNLAPPNEGESEGSDTRDHRAVAGRGMQPAERPSYITLRSVFAIAWPCRHAALSNPQPLSLTGSFKHRVCSSESVQTCVAPECLAILLTNSSAVQPDLCAPLRIVTGAPLFIHAASVSGRSTAVSHKPKSCLIRWQGKHAHGRLSAAQTSQTNNPCQDLRISLVIPLLHKADWVKRLQHAKSLFRTTAWVLARSIEQSVPGSVKDALHR